MTVEIVYGSPEVCGSPEIVFGYGYGRAGIKNRVQHIEIALREWFLVIKKTACQKRGRGRWTFG